jgi:uncharacterized membrane protein
MKFTSRTLPITILCLSLTCAAALAQVQSPASGTFNPRRGLASRMKAQPMGAANHPAQAQTPGSPALTLTFGMIDFPGQAASGAFGINDKGEITGGYGQDLNDAFYLKGGKFTPIGFPGAAFTLANAINDSGVLVGVYGITEDNDEQGFELVGKTYTTINFPGATETAVVGISNSGDMVGVWQFDLGDDHGFLLTKKGVFTSFDYPGAVYTLAFGINKSGVIVGQYGSSDGSTHGFVLQNGTFTTLDYPGGYSQNYLGSINDQGVIVGLYGEPTVVNGVPYNGQHCLIYQNGEFSNCDVPFGPAAVTESYQINNSGVFVGEYVDNSGTTYGFEATITP